MKKIIIDVCMCIGLLVLMSYQMVGADVHEYIGMIEGALYIVHLILNRNWWMHIGKGSYNFFRVLQTSLFVGIFICFIIQIGSGILVSKTIFASLPIQGLQSIGRQSHMVAAYWGFVLLSLHIGLHIPVWSAKVKATYQYAVMHTICIGILTCYGAYAFIKREIISYMFLRVKFVYFDFDESLVFFLFDYFCMLVFFAISIHYFVKGTRYLKKIHHRKDEGNETIRK